MIVSHCSIKTQKHLFLIVIIFFSVLHYSCLAETKNNDSTEKTEISLAGSATRNNNIISVNIRNYSTDKADILIPLGEVAFLNLDKNDSANIIKSKVISVLGDPYVAKVSVSDSNMKFLTCDQFLPLKLLIPKELINVKIDFIEITIRFCKVPITTKTIQFENHTLRLPIHILKK